LARPSSKLTGDTKVQGEVEAETGEEDFFKYAHLGPRERALSKGIQRRNEALRRIGVTPEQMLGKAIITPQLKDGSWLASKPFLEALRASEDEDAVAFLSKYDQVPVGDREKLTWEEIAVAAGISPEGFDGGIHDCPTRCASRTQRASWR